VSINTYSVPLVSEWIKMKRRHGDRAPSSSAKTSQRERREPAAPGVSSRPPRDRQAAPGEPSANLGDLATILLRRWPSILLLTLAALSVAVSYLWTTPPTYQATTTLFIDPRPKKVVTDDPSQTGLGTDFALLESQVAIIRSDAVLSRVVASMKLDADPEFAPPPSTGFKSQIKEYLGIKTPPVEPAAQALLTLAQHVVVKRAQKTYVVEIEATSSRPVMAARLTQAIVDAYLADQTNAKSEEAKRAYAQIDGRLGELREQVRKAELRVDEFRKANRIMTSEGGTVGEQQLTRLNTELSTVRSALAEAKARMDEVAAATKTGNLDSVTDPAKTALVQRLREQLAQVSRREASLSSQLLPHHPVLVDIRSQAADLKAQIDTELKRVAATIKAEYQVAEAREREVVKTLETAKSEVGRTNTAQIKQRELEQEVTASRELLRIFLARAKETDEQQRITSLDARVISPASVPTRPAKPVPALILGLGLLGGLAAGISRALMLDHFDHSLRSAGDVERRTRLRTIGSIPLLPRTSNPAGSRSTKDMPRSAGSCEFGEITRALTTPATGETLRFRLKIANLLAALRFDGTDSANHVLMVVSPDGTAASAGTAFALATAAAERGDRVLLVDAASARSTLSDRLADQMPNRAISLDDKADLASIANTDTTNGLTLLPIALADLSRLKLDQQRRLLQGLTALSGDYDLVVVDGGAALEDPSATILKPFASAIVLVAVANRTGAENLETAANLLDPARDRLAGVVLVPGTA